MSRQYIPFTIKIENIPLIIYPVKDENPLEEVFDNKKEIIEHINKLYKQNTLLIKGEYHVLFVWNLDKERMTDIWIYEMENWSDSGPLISCKTFRGCEECTDAGIASGDSIIVLGREEELRRNS
ncbi:MAG: hypothetical protein XD93_0228, partial [candidate division WS6 bacterium 34_10]